MALAQRFARHSAAAKGCLSPGVLFPTSRQQLHAALHTHARPLTTARTVPGLSFKGKRFPHVRYATSQASIAPNTKSYIDSGVVAGGQALIDVKKVLVIGSGGLTIGQAGEFDYSGEHTWLVLDERGSDPLQVLKLLKRSRKPGSSRSWSTQTLLPFRHRMLSPTKSTICPLRQSTSPMSLKRRDRTASFCPLAARRRSTSGLRWTKWASLTGTACASWEPASRH